MNEDSFSPLSASISTSISKPRLSPSSSTSTCTTSNSRPPPPTTLCPIPGVLPGSRKRRVFSRHGPFSSAIGPDVSSGEEGPGDDLPSNSTTQCSAKVTPVMSLMAAHGSETEAEISLPRFSRTSNCSPPVTPKGPSKDTKGTISGNDFTESFYRTPARGKNTSINGHHHQGITMSPTSSEMQLFQHLSIRSPRLSKSPGSSFSQYTRSATSVGASVSASACGVALNTPLTAQGSFDGSDANTSVPNQHQYSNRMVPLTILSNKFSSNQGIHCEYPTPTSSQAHPSSGIMDTSTTRKTLTPRSASMIISPRPIKPSGYLPCPTPRSLPSPRRMSTNLSSYNDVEQNYSGQITKQAAVVSVEKPVPQCRRSPFGGVSPMMSLSPLNKPITANSISLPSVRPPPPPIAFLSTDQGKNKNTKGDNDNDEGQLEAGPWDLKRKSSLSMSASRSLFKPASSSSNDALNELLYDEGDTDGTLSDSDDEGGDNGFFLSDPSCLSFPCVIGLPPRGSLSSTLNSQSRRSNSNANSGQTQGCEVDMSLAAAYSLKTKKKKVHDTKGGDYPTFPSLNSNFDKRYTSQNHTFSKQAREQNKEGSTSESNTSLFGMNIIHENSISNGSLADIGMFSSTKKTSCRSFTNNEEYNQPSGSLLNRSKSDQSINSIGLCIDNYTGSNDGYSSRDMVTPPVNCRDMSSPPPLKQTRLTANKK